MIRTKRIVKRRKESIMDRHRKNSFRVAQGDSDGLQGLSAPSNPDAKVHQQIEESVTMAVKIVQHNQPYMPVALAKNCKHEIEALARCAGDCVVSLYGVAFNEPTMSIVSPLYNQGSLYSLVRKQEWKKMPAKHRFKIYHELSMGMNAIHESLTIHGDVKSHNMLVHYDPETKAWSAAVGDVGSAIFLENKDEKVTKEQGTAGWTAPEVFTGEGYGMPSDVFSFAIVLCDASSNGADAPGWPGSLDTYVDRLVAGERPALGPSDGSGLQQLIEFGWKTKPEQRPNSKQIMDRLHEVVTHL
jgi:serine/threonine protein kinase